MEAADAVAPAYGTGSLAEVVPSALAALGFEGWRNDLGLPSARSYVVMLVDGLGWNLLRRNAASAPYLSSLAEHGRPITSGVPSTTATSLTSLGTGLPPGLHGVVGFTSRVPGTTRLLDALKWDTRVDPLEWQPNPTTFETAFAQGVPVTVVSRRMFEHSGLTRAGQRGGQFVGADYIGERLDATIPAAQVPGSLTYLYDGELDATGHRNGCESNAWAWQLEAVDHFVEVLRSQLPRDCALAVVADHGMVDVPFSARLDVDDEPDLTTGVAVFGGEARFRHLYCKASELDSLASRWRDRMGEAAIVKTRDDAVETGWFGAVSAAVCPRLGDVMVASLAKTAVVSRSRFPREAKLLGLHGSLTAEEMLVPLLIAPAL